jgi:hypothetical protein
MVLDHATFLATDMGAAVAHRVIELTVRAESQPMQVMAEKPDANAIALA